MERAATGNAAGGIRGALERIPQHEHEPQASTVYSHTCLKVEPGREQPGDYPLDAMCAGCGQPIRLEHERDDWDLKRSGQETPDGAESLARGSALTDLRNRWGDCYVFARVGEWWIAERRDNGATVTRGTPGELLTEVENDHAVMPVPIECRAEQVGLPRGTGWMDYPDPPER